MRSGDRVLQASEPILSFIVNFKSSETHVMPGITQGISSRASDPSDVFLEFPSQEESVDNAGVTLFLNNP